MPTITFVEFSGRKHEVQGQVGESVMQVAMNNSVPGILADCGGNCSCATCHVYVDAQWQNRFAPPAQGEKDMLECALHVRDNSRLSCQLPLTPDLDGLVVHLPESQT